jgi:ABC-2 type transport system permease protein
MIRTLVILILNDVAIAFKNKTLYLILFIPLFVFLSLKLIDGTEAGFQKIRIGLVQKENYPPLIVQRIQSSSELFAFFWLSSKQEGKRWLKEKKVDGILVPSEKEPEGLELTVLTKASFQTLAIIERFSALQIAAEGKSKNWISDIRSLQDSGIQKQTLPTWILMLVLLVGFIIIPAQVAEEKEKKLLLGLLQTPMREIEWLLAKLFLGMILVGIAAVILHLPGKFDFDFGGGLSYVAFLIAASFCFSALGTLVGFSCRSQASARTLGVLFYLPHLLPSALSDFSQKLSKLAPMLPSYQFYEPMKSILLEGRTLSDFSLEWVYLLLVGSFACLSSYLLMKKRWLM